jgi:hypothetical protein
MVYIPQPHCLYEKCCYFSKLIHLINYHHIVLSGNFHHYQQFLYIVNSNPCPTPYTTSVVCVPTLTSIKLHVNGVTVSTALSVGNWSWKRMFQFFEILGALCMRSPERSLAWIWIEADSSWPRRIILPSWINFLRLFFPSWV